MERIRVVLVDDHQVVIDSLRIMMDREPDLLVVGEATTAADAYQVVETHEPDLLVIDIGLPPGVNGIATIRELIRRKPQRRILILSTFTDVEHVAQALAAGARGYAIKTQPSKALLEAIRAVADGRTYLAPSISHFVVDDHLRFRRGESVMAGPLDVLSCREKEVFDLLVHGHSNDSAASNLCISVKTVETHRSHILKKLRAHSLVELVRFAARHSLLE